MSGRVEVRLGEAARSRWSWRRCAAIALAACASAAGCFAETLTIGGTGSSGPLTEKLFADFARNESGIQLKLVKPPMGSGGAMKAILANRIDLAIIGRPLKEEEKPHIGGHFPLAETLFVLAGRGAEADLALSLPTLADIFAGRRVSWPSGKPMRLVLRPSFDSDTALLRGLSAQMAIAVDAAGARPGMAIGSDDLETLGMLERIDGTLGPTTLGLLRTTDSSLSPLPIDGMRATAATLADGSYPWRKKFAVVLPDRQTEAAKKFADYLRSERASAVLAHYGYRRIGQ